MSRNYRQWILWPWQIIWHKGDSIKGSSFLLTLIGPCLSNLCFDWYPLWTCTKWRKEIMKNIVLTNHWLRDIDRLSAIPFMQRLLNQSEKKKQEMLRQIDNSVPVTNGIFTWPHHWDHKNFYYWTPRAKQAGSYQTFTTFNLLLLHSKVTQKTTTSERREKRAL